MIEPTEPASNRVLRHLNREQERQVFWNEIIVVHRKRLDAVVAQVVLPEPSLLLADDLAFFEQSGTSKKLFGAALEMVVPLFRLLAGCDSAKGHTPDEVLTKYLADIVAFAASELSQATLKLIIALAESVPRAARPDCGPLGELLAERTESTSTTVNYGPQREVRLKLFACEVWRCSCLVRDELQQHISSDQPCIAQSIGPERRRQAVDAFLRKVHEETGVKVVRKHIWLAVHHKQARQFEHWQAGRDYSISSKRGATKTDDRNFSRILGMASEDFLSKSGKAATLDRR